MPDVIAGFVAFLRRAFARELGREAKFGHNLRQRAGQALLDLKRPEKSILFRSRLEMLRWESDLFYEEDATDEVLLALQTRIIELAPTNEAARKIAETMLSEPPMAALVAGILVETLKQDCNEIEFHALDGDTVAVNTRGEKGWEEAMTVPATLWRPLHGLLFRMHHAGYSNVRPYLRFPESLPTELEFIDLTDRRVHVRLPK
jgi:hypothetical protein